MRPVSPWLQNVYVGRKVGTGRRVAVGGEDLVGRWVARTSSRSCEDVNYLYQRNGRWGGEAVQWR